MFGQQQTNEKSLVASDFERIANVLLFVVRAWATSIEVFIRRGIGRRYLGWNAVAVLILVPSYSVHWERYDLRPMMWFLVAYLFMCALVRASHLRQGNRDHHSRYNGYPAMVKANAQIDEVRFKQFCEPFVVAMIGAALIQFSPPLGWYIIFGAVALCIQSTVWHQVQEVQVMDMTDAMLEQSQLAERFRSRDLN